MPKKCGKKKEEVKPGRTLADFFGGNNQKVVLVECPACGRRVSQGRINWHLDYDCGTLGTKKDNDEEKEEPNGGHTLRQRTAQPDGQNGAGTSTETEVTSSGEEYCPPVAQKRTPTKKRTPKKKLEVVTEVVTLSQSSRGVSSRPSRYHIPEEFSSSQKVSPGKRASRFSPHRYMNKKRKSDPDASSQSSTDTTPSKTPNKSPLTNWLSGSQEKSAGSPNKTQNNAASKSPGADAKSARRNLSKDLEYDEDQDSGYSPYYLSNFEFIINAVLHDADNLRLLDSTDMQHIETFKSLPKNAQKLYVRLYNRKQTWKRKGDIRYTDVGDVSETLELLAEKGLVMDGSNVPDLQSALSLLYAKQMQELCRDMKLPITGGKEEMSARLIKNAARQKSVFFTKTDLAGVTLKKALNLVGSCFVLSPEPRDTFSRMMLLFSLPHRQEEDFDGRQQMLTLLMVNMGKMTFPYYRVWKESHIFRSKADLVQYQEANRLEEDMTKALEAKNWDKAMEVVEAARKKFEAYTADHDMQQHLDSLPKWLRMFSARCVAFRVMWQGIHVLQRKGDHEGAVSELQRLLAEGLLSGFRKGEGYERLALNLSVHLKKPKEAMLAIQEGLSDSDVQGCHKVALSQRAVRICSRKTVPSKLKKIMDALTLWIPDQPKVVTIQGRKLESVTGMRSVFLREGSSPSGTVASLSSVEEFALSHYQLVGYERGVHAEGTLPVSLFGMFFWDCLYEEEHPDSFLSQYQPYPLDLCSQAFYERRQEGIESRLCDLCMWEVEDACQYIEECWNRHHGTLSIISWDLFASVNTAKELVACIGLSILHGLFERLVKEYRHFRNGFPDLVVWDPSTKRSLFVEVKGPGDTLSTRQLVWMDYLRTIGAPVELCRVEAVKGKRFKLAT